MIEKEGEKRYNNDLTKKDDIRLMDTTVLAYIGDAAYELYVRRRILEANSRLKAGKLHELSVRYVCSDAQAKAVKELAPFLTEEERELVRRARNKKSISRSRNLTPMSYKLSTAFEALIGYYFIREEQERARQIMGQAMQIIDGTGAEVAETNSTGAEAAKTNGTGAEAAKTNGTSAEAAKTNGTGAEAAQMNAPGGQRETDV